ncbi:MAG: Double zinc ribbon, partial [Proteobacteria bacterium]|nr:Double zinc ribbon [Pseudomonadota bacterium]
MVCSRCQCQLERDAKTCSQCGQDVVPAMQLDFPCVLCGAPIPAGVEECPHCGKISSGHLPGADVSSPAPVVEPMDTPEPVPVELDAFQLDVVAIQAAPPPPVPRAPVVEFFEPLPTLLHVDEPPESVPTSVSVKASAPAVAPAPPVSIVLPVVPAKPVQAKVVESPVPAAPPAVVAETRTETKVETFKAPLPPSQPGPRTVPVWPPQEEEALGPQPEDVIDEDELRRRRALRQLVLVV